MSMNVYQGKINGVRQGREDYNLVLRLQDPKTPNKTTYQWIKEDAPLSLGERVLREKAQEIALQCPNASITPRNVEQVSHKRPGEELEVDKTQPIAQESATAAITPPPTGLKSAISSGKSVKKQRVSLPPEPPAVPPALEEQSRTVQNMLQKTQEEMGKFFELFKEEKKNSAESLFRTKMQTWDLKKNQEELQQKTAALGKREEMLHEREQHVISDKEQLKKDLASHGDQVLKLVALKDKVEDEQALLKQGQEQLLIDQAFLQATISDNEIKGCELEMQQSELEELQKNLDARELGLNKREDTIMAKDQSLNERRLDLNQRESTIKANDRALKARESDLNKRESTIKAKDQSLNERESGLNQRESIIKAKEEEIQKQQLQVADLQVMMSKFLAAAQAGSKA
jgi:DNA repair exonuclease SbcCD ATPase subunit